MKEQTYKSQMPAGAERYGATSGIEQAGIMPSYIMPGVEPAPPSGNKYEGDQGVCSFVYETHDQCRGPRAKGTDYCIGHLRHIEKELKKQEEKQGTPSDSE